MMRSNKGICLGLYLVLFFLISGWSAEKGKNEPSMTIPLRVFSQKTLIKTLSINDLTIHDNNQVQTITEIKTIRKSIGASPQKPRLFLLFFQVNDYQKEIKKLLNMIFENVLNEQDQLIILVNDKTIFFESLTEKKEAFKTVDQVVAQESEKNRISMAVDVKKMESFISYLRKDTQRTSGDDQATQAGGKIHRHYYMKYFFSYLERYLKMIRDYNKQYLHPRLDKFHFVFNQIKNVKKEKWIIHIHQMAKLPVLSKKNRSMIVQMVKDLSDRDLTEAWYDELDYAKKISKVKGYIDEELGVTSTFPTDEITSIIYKINATLFSIFNQPNEERLGKNQGHQKVYAEMKAKWETVANRTGGTAFNSPNPEKNIEKLASQEDVIHMVSFIRKDPQIPAKIKMIPNNKQFTLFFDSNPDPEYFNDHLTSNGFKAQKIKIRLLHFEQKRLSLVINGFQMENMDDQVSGRIYIRLVIKDDMNQVGFDENKNFLARKNEIKITINLEGLNKEYNKVYTEVTDLLSSDTSIKTFKIIDD